MRKRIIASSPPPGTPAGQNWLDLESLATVEVTSEDPAHPVEAALVAGRGSGWRAAQAGKQTLRLLFDEPQSVQRIHLLFKEDQHQRTQEFVLRWSSGNDLREILRQQYGFNPPGVELEDYTVDLQGVKTIELEIIPSISGGSAVASLAELRLG
ncbi:MAG: hypothetical protein QOE70_371 [Chthoniobacter sp.]|jgi:hypothetical protein|nr:hypothetical protein [Chthoniobacter sp.]